jgi:amidophosphoribosyltransferase
MLDRFREECGLMGVWGHPEAANLAYLGIFAVQHRGQEGAGIVALEPETKKFSAHRGLGLVADIFDQFDFEKLPGKAAIGHNRYTTAGGNVLANVQPFYSQVSRGGLAVAHNGNLINTDALRQKLIREGAIFSSSSDTELFLHLIARSDPKLPVIEAVKKSLEQTKGAYSLLILLEDRLLAVRDPAGLRPLAMGRLDGDGAVVFASETCAFDLIGATYERDVEPGEIVEVTDSGIKSYFPFEKQSPTPCIFEYVYFSRPDSKVFKQNVYSIRSKMGEELAREHPVKADLVIPVPDSGVTAAMGYSRASGIPIEQGLIRNHYIGRTFIEPQQSIRDFGVKIKLNANPGVVSGKDIVVVDDSIVRGTTVKKLIHMLRRAGANKVHMRISAPPTTDPCYYGVDTPSKGELIASRLSVEEIKDFIGADSLGYLSIEGLYKASGGSEYCAACFTGKYPLGTPADF